MKRAPDAVYDRIEASGQLLYVVEVTSGATGVSAGGGVNGLIEGQRS